MSTSELPRVLLTGFEPFGGENVNPSMQAVQALAAAAPPGVALATAILPVSAAKTGPALRAAIALHRPAIVIATGEAGGRTEVTVERVGININDFRIPDNDGAQPIDLPVVPGGPAAYFATIPVRLIVEALRQAGIPASISNSAGAHLCNHTLYLLGHLAATEYAGMRCGFIHLPGLPEQAVRHPGQPSMSTATATAALAIAVRVAAGLSPAPVG